MKGFCFVEFFFLLLPQKIQSSRQVLFYNGCPFFSCFLVLASFLDSSQKIVALLKLDTICNAILLIETPIMPGTTLYPFINCDTMSPCFSFISSNASGQKVCECRQKPSPINKSKLYDVLVDPYFLPIFLSLILTGVEVCLNDSLSIRSVSGRRVRYSHTAVSLNVEDSLIS